MAEGKAGCLRLAFLCSSSSWGGLEMNVLRFAGYLSEVGHKVTLLAVEGTPLWDASAGIDMERRSILRHRKYADIGKARSLARLFDELKTDIVWIRDTRDMSICGWAKQFSKRDIRIVYQQAMQLGVPKRDLIHTLRFRQIDRWIAPLQFLANQVVQLTRYPKDRIAVIPLAVEPENFIVRHSPAEVRQSFGLPQEGLLLGNIGRIDPLKGQMILVESLPALRKSAGNVHVVIIGEPTRNEGTAYLDALHDRSRQLDVERYVHFLPFTRDVARAYACLDVFAMTSSGETFGMVTIEAMISGKAIIGTQSSGTPELLEHGDVGVLYPPGDQKAFTQAVEPLLQSIELRERLGRTARNSALKRFAKNAVIARIETMLNDLMPPL